MTPAGNGRHCGACNKVVVDFTRMTDAEVVAWFRQAMGQRVCGRLHPTQVERVLVGAVEPAGLWYRWMLATLALLGLREGTGEVAVAQTKVKRTYLRERQELDRNAPYPVPKSVKVEDAGGSWTGEVVTKKAGKVAGEVTLRGRVIDRTTHEPIQGVDIIVHGDSGQPVGYAASDTTGHYQLVLKERPGRCQVSFKLITYDHLTVQVPMEQQVVDLGTVELQELHMMLGGAVAGIERPPLAAAPGVVESQGAGGCGVRQAAGSGRVAIRSGSRHQLLICPEPWIPFLSECLPSCWSACC